LVSESSLLPLAAASGTILFMSLRLIRPGRLFGRHVWVVPAALSVLFLGFSLAAVLAEGPVGFWGEHTRSLWGNQIWFDLLLAVCIGWYFAVPQAVALGMRLRLWLALILATGCIGFLAMLARMLYLREHSRPGLFGEAATGPTPLPPPVVAAPQAVATTISSIRVV
jgi:hypothetical protein